MRLCDILRVELDDGRVLGLDVKGDVSYISHAHSDHVNGRNKKVVLSSDPTLDISRISYESRASFSNVRLYNAGHMLGATQAEIIGDDGAMVYTGDISLKDGFTFKGADILESDMLVIEATYGSQEYQFPEKEDLAEVLRREVLSRTAYGNVIFAVYSTGKAQELIKMLNEYCDITPVVSPEIADKSSAYVKHGCSLSYVSSASDDAPGIFRGNFVGIIPKPKFRPELRTRLMQHYKRPVYFGSLSGWNLKYPSDYYDISLPMSDHADFNDLIDYVDHSNPKSVYVFGAFAESFSNVLKLRGHNSYVVR